MRSSRRSGARNSSNKGGCSPFLASQVSTGVVARLSHSRTPQDSIAAGTLHREKFAATLWPRLQGRRRARYTARQCPRSTRLRRAIGAGASHSILPARRRSTFYRRLCRSSPSPCPSTLFLPRETVLAHVIRFIPPVPAWPRRLPPGRPPPPTTSRTTSLCMRS